MVMAGYKQTEIGEIPEDWGLQKIGELARVGSGGTPNRGVEAYWNGTIPWITTSLIDGGEINNALEHISDVGLKYSSAKIFKAGTLLVAMYGQGKTRGKAAILGIDAAINQACAAIVVNDSMVPLFVLQYLNSKYLTIRELSNSGGQENLSSGIIKGILVPKPEKAEQEAIVAALSDADALIASLEKLIDKQRDIKTATLQQLLTGKRRLQGFGEGKGTKQTELGEIPEDWDAARIGDSFDFKNGLNKAKAYFGCGTPIVNYMDVFSNHGLDASRIHGLVQVSREEINSYSARKGDVFFTRTSETVDEIGQAAALVDDVPSAVFSGFILRARERDHKDSLSLEFKKYCFSSDVVRKQIRSTSSYTTRALTNGKLLSEVRFPRPRDVREQAEIAQAISNMETEISSVDKLLQKTKAIKQGMMQQLLTGRTRLV